MYLSGSKIKNFNIKKHSLYMINVSYTRGILRGAIKRKIKLFIIG